MILGSAPAESASDCGDSGNSPHRGPADAVHLVRLVERRLSARASSLLNHVTCQIESDTLVLSGAVPSYYAKQLAQEVVLELKLPLRVQNHCEVRCNPTNQFVD